MPVSHIKRKLPTVFLSLCICLLVLFLANVYYDDKVEESSQADSGLASLGGIRRGNRRHRKRIDASDDDDLVCHMPKLRIEHDANADAFHEMPPLVCKDSNLFFMSHDQLFVNKTTLGDKKIKKCSFKIIKWQTDSFYEITEVHDVTTEPFTLKIPSDFFKVECWMEAEEEEKGQEEMELEEAKVDSEMSKQEAESQPGKGGIPNVVKEPERQADGDPKVSGEDIPRPGPYGSMGLPDPDVTSKDSGRL